MLNTLYAKPSQAELDARRANAPGLRALVQNLHRDPPGPSTDNRLAQTNHFTGVIYIAICAIAKAMAGSTLRVMQRKAEPQFQSKKSRRIARERGLIRKAMGPIAGAEHHDDDLVEAPRTDRFVKLFNHVNATQTLGDLLTAWVTQRKLTSQSVVWGRASQLGWESPPCEFYVLPTALVQPLYGVWGNGELDENSAYPYGAIRLNSLFPSGMYSGISSAPGTIIDAREIKRHRMYHPLYPWDGMSPLTACGVQFDIHESIAQAWKAAFDHGFRPAGVVTIKGASQETVDLASATANQAHGGSRNFYRLIFSNGDGVGFEPFERSNSEMEFLSAWDAVTKFALAVMGVPPAIAGISEATSYAQLFASLKQFYTLELAPEARGISQFLTKNFVYPYEQGTIVQITIPEIDDKEQELKNRDQLAKYGVITGNELRGKNGMAPRDDCEELIGKAPEPAPMADDQPEPGGVPDDVSPGQNANDVLRSKLGLSGAGGDVPKPSNDAGRGSLPGKMSKSVNRLRSYVEALS